MELFLCDNCDTLATVKVLADTIQITKCKCQTEQKEEQTMTQTINFVTFPFRHKGIDFVSRIAETNRHLPQIMLMGEAFIQMNKNAVDELINIEETTSLAELQAVIAYINEGGTEMFLELAGA
jgi:pterin-4a-carbinolamine dehydratase